MWAHHLCCWFHPRIFLRVQRGCFLLYSNLPYYLRQTSLKKILSPVDNVVARHLQFFVGTSPMWARWGALFNFVPPDIRHVRLLFPCFVPGAHTQTREGISAMVCIRQSYKLLSVLRFRPWVSSHFMRVLFFCRARIYIYWYIHARYPPPLYIYDTTRDLKSFKLEEPGSRKCIYICIIFSN